MPNPLRIAALMVGELPAPDDPKWAEKMRAVITRGHLAAWMSATSERLGVPLDSPLLSRQRLSRAEREEIKGIVEKQLQYLKGFEQDREGMSEAAIQARSELYPGAVSQTWYSTRWGDWEIPDQLLPGNQQCVTRCKCSISVKDNGDGTGTLTRTMGGTEHHCSECPPLAGDHPVTRRGATKALDDWDDSEIDTWDDDAVKHMPGGHDQRSHGRATGRRVAARSAYRDARSAGGSVAEARIAARAASQYLARAQRMENIIKQQQGYMSPAQRRSSEAELDRLASEQDAYLSKVPPHLHGPVNDAISRAPVTQATVRGRQDPRGQQHSAAARDAHRRMSDIEGEIERQKEPIRDKRRKNWDRQEELMKERAALINQQTQAEIAGDTARARMLDKDIERNSRQLKKTNAENKRLLKEALEVEGAAPRNILAVDNPARVELRFADNMTPQQKQRVEQAVTEASRLTSTRGLDGHPIRVEMRPGVRAHAQDYGEGFTLSGEMVFAPHDASRVIAHELGHHIEYRNPEVKRRAQEFLDRRTRGEPVTKLSALTGNQHYDDHEVAQPDRFISPYMGKRYAHGSTEIISMGIEHFYADPVSFAKADPDYFMFIYDVLRT